MTRLARAAQRTLLSSVSSFSSSSSASTLIHGLQGHSRSNSLVQSRNAVYSYLFQSRPIATISFFEENILRILQNEIEYQLELAPSHQLPTRFHSFMVQDRPGEMWMKMKGRYNDVEDIKLEVTMFDGFEIVPTPGYGSGEVVRLHNSILVHVTKGDDSDALVFVCSAWPDNLEIQKVYLLRHDKILATPYIGPHFRNLNDELRKRLRDFLEARGINDELAVFLHECMMNKDRIELLQWLGRVKSFVGK